MEMICEYQDFDGGETHILRPEWVLRCDLDGSAT